MQNFSVFLNSAAGIPYAEIADEDNDLLRESKAQFRRRFVSRSIENQEDINAVLVHSVMAIPLLNVTTEDQILNCNSYAMFYIDQILLDIITGRFICYFTLQGAATPQEFLELNLQPDQSVDFDRCVEILFARSEVTNAIKNAKNAAHALRAARLQPPAPMAPIPAPQPANQMAEVMRGAITATKAVSDRVTMFQTHLLQAQGAYMGTDVIADVFFPTAPSILAQQAVAPNALMPVAVEPPQLPMSERVQPHRLRLELAVARMQQLILGTPRYGFTHPLAGIKQESVLALAVLRFSSTKAPNTADLATDFCIVPKDVSQLAELFEYIAKFYNCVLFNAAIGMAIRSFLQQIVDLGRRDVVFGSRAGISALLHVANVKLGSLTDPSSPNASGAGLSLLAVQSSAEVLAGKLATALTVSENDSALVSTMLSVVLSQQPTVSSTQQPRPPPPFPPSASRAASVVGKRPRDEA